jgi:hypothetical protein
MGLLKAMPPMMVARVMSVRSNGELAAGWDHCVANIRVAGRRWLYGQPNAQIRVFVCCLGGRQCTRAFACVGIELMVTVVIPCRFQEWKIQTWLKYIDD